jgi:hypothetical protein
VTQDAIIALTLAGGLITLVTFVSTAVWTVAQIKEVTSNLKLEVRHLAKEISNLSVTRDDHEGRLRAIEKHHNGCNQ